PAEIASVVSYLASPAAAYITGAGDQRRRRNRDAITDGGLNVNERTRSFLEKHHSAAMTTLRADGTPHVARVGVALVAGKVWSSGTQTRVRTKHLRLFEVMQQGMGVPDGQINWFGRTISQEEFLKMMVEEQRLIYEFEIIRSYGMY